MIRSLLVLAPGLAIQTGAAHSASAQRQRLSMDPGWRRLDLPHDWSVEGTPSEDAPGGGRVGYYPAGLGWYRKAFRLPAGDRSLTAWLEFDGIYMNGEVWLNGVRLGMRPFGYNTVKYDVTEHLVSGVNVVAVRVDNSAQPNSRWYTGSGIYRHVWLTLVDRLHVGHWGTFVTTPRADSAATEPLTIAVAAPGLRPATLTVAIAPNPRVRAIPPAG